MKKMLLLLALSSPFCVNATELDTRYKNVDVNDVYTVEQQEENVLLRSAITRACYREPRGERNNYETCRNNEIVLDRIAESL
uniref:hypothetical protein n=1 Tax=Thaumasiovibrio occultus TaxID=1891184 RepID=UPI000B353AFA|nr:hypothetical protein [Thaumasiovibrio occultus]